MKQRKKSNQTMMFAIAVGIKIAFVLAGCAPSDRAAEIVLLSGDVENGFQLYDEH